jgi:very-short-patch-repair endonuclease
MYGELTKRGYRVTPQVKVGSYRIDMVVEGHNDARQAVECDGDKHHGADKWADDMQRERNIRRAGWGVFWRCFATSFIRRRRDMLDDLLKTLAERGIEPIGAEGAPRSVHTERRLGSFVTPPKDQDDLMAVEVAASAQTSPPAVRPAPSSSVSEDAPPAEAPPLPPTDDGNLPGGGQVLVPSVRSGDGSLSFSEYSEYSGSPGSDPRSVNMIVVSEGIVRIVEVEGPVVAKRAYDIYLRGCGIRRMGPALRSAMNKALAHAVRQGRLVSENEPIESGLLFSVVRVHGRPPIRLRRRGPRSFEEIPPSELKVVAMYLVQRHGFSSGSDEHLRAVLEYFDLKRLTTQVGTTLLEILERRFPYVDEFINKIPK